MNWSLLWCQSEIFGVSTGLNTQAVFDSLHFFREGFCFVFFSGGGSRLHVKGGEGHLHFSGVTHHLQCIMIKADYGISALNVALVYD